MPRRRNNHCTTIILDPAKVAELIAASDKPHNAIKGYWQSKYSAPSTRKGPIDRAYYNRLFPDTTPLED